MSQSIIPGGNGEAQASIPIRLNDFKASGTGHAPGGVPDPGAVAGSTKFLFEDATWATPGGGGSPAVSDTQIQFNDGGSAFGADANLTWDKTGGTLQITSSSGVPLNLFDGATGHQLLQFAGVGTYVNQPNGAVVLGDGNSDANNTKLTVDDANQKASLNVDFLIDEASYTLPYAGAGASKGVVVPGRDDGKPYRIYVTSGAIAVEAAF